MSPLLETYEQAIEFLFGRINYERAQVDSYSSTDFKLERMQRLLELVGNPHERLPAVHVAGTKGKGSTCNMLAAVLTAAGLRTGLYTSPHLVRFEERMVVDGVLPTPEELVALVNRVQGPVNELDGQPTLIHPTYFEIATALAWLNFERCHAEVAVLETGLGGRLDSTNLCRPWITVLTNVSRDHTQILGSTVREIAAEKAGIIKPGIPVISGALHPDAQAVIAERAARLNAPLWLLGRDIQWHWSDNDDRGGRIDVTTPSQTWRDVPVTLRGEHQATNTALAVAALDRLRDVGVTITPETLTRGLLQVRWPGRVEVLGHHPTVVIDAAHNWESAKALIRTLRHDFPPAQQGVSFAPPARGGLGGGGGQHAGIPPVRRVGRVCESHQDAATDEVGLATNSNAGNARALTPAQPGDEIQRGRTSPNPPLAGGAKEGEEEPLGRRLLVFATTRDKDYRGLLRQLVPEFDTLIFTKYLDNPRAVPAEELRNHLAAITDRQVHIASDPYAAWKLARRLAQPHDLIVITGSFFLVGELRDLVREELNGPELQPGLSPSRASRS